MKVRLIFILSISGYLGFRAFVGRLELYPVMWPFTGLLGEGLATFSAMGAGIIVFVGSFVIWKRILKTAFEPTKKDSVYA